MRVKFPDTLKAFSKESKELDRELKDLENKIVTLHKEAYDIKQARDELILYTLSTHTESIVSSLEEEEFEISCIREEPIIKVWHFSASRRCFEWFSLYIKDILFKLVDGQDFDYYPTINKAYDAALSNNIASEDELKKAHLNSLINNQKTDTITYSKRT